MEKSSKEKNLIRKQKHKPSILGRCIGGCMKFTIKHPCKTLVFVTLGGMFFAYGGAALWTGIIIGGGVLASDKISVKKLFCQELPSELQNINSYTESGFQVKQKEIEKIALVKQYTNTTEAPKCWNPDSERYAEIVMNLQDNETGTVFSENKKYYKTSIEDITKKEKYQNGFSRKF